MHCIPGKEGFFMPIGHPSRKGDTADSAASPLVVAGVRVVAGEAARPVLHNIDLTIRPGEWVTVAGENGSGKSTLLGVIAGLIEPDAGTVSRGFAGEGTIPCVMQQVGPFFGDTPWEETLFAMEGSGVRADAVPTLAEEALAATGLHPLRHRPIETLSGGRRQLVSVAACLAVGAPLILFDEATSMLDGRSRRLVLETAFRLHREGVSVLWASHRPEESAPDGRIVVLHSGEIVYDDSAESFFYGEDGYGRTPCERFGFTPPFAVRTARALQRRGWRPAPLPLFGEEPAAVRLEPAAAADNARNVTSGQGAVAKRDDGTSGGRTAPPGRNAASPSAGGIRVERATYAADGKPVLAGIDAAFPAGTITLLIGPNGSGKTMLLEMIAGLRKPDAGQVYVDGIALWRGRKPDRRLLHRIGFVTQNPEQMLFARTVREEFAYSLKPFRWPEQRRTAAMEQAAGRWLGGEGDNGGPSDAGLPCPDVRSAGTRMKGGRDRILDLLAEDPLTLSGGRRRRLAVAATEVTEPDWLLLDEPSAGLDRSSLRRLLSTLAERRAAGRGAIVVTHDPEDWLSLADGVVLIRDGRAIWSGSPAELAEHPELWAKAGMELPEPFRTAEWLRRSGFRPPSGLPDPETLADALASQAAAAWHGNPPSPVPGDTAGGRSYAASGHEALVAGADATCSRLPDERPQPPAESIVAAGLGGGGHRTGPPAGRLPAVPEAIAESREADSGRLSALTAFDPRALWLACLAVTAGIGIQTSWAGWLLGAVTSVLVLRFSGVPTRVIVRPAKALLLFALLTSLFAGWNPSADAAFDAHAAVETFRRFSKLVMMALLGYSLMAGISPYRLKRSLEKGLKPLSGLGLPVGRFALAASLLLRFLPLLLESWDRFARIAASRGKRPVKPGSVPLPLVIMTVVPFLLALIRLGESLADMLAVRGAGEQTDRNGRLAAAQSPHRAEKTAAGRLGATGSRHRCPGNPAPAFSRRDLLLIAGSVLLFALFLLTENTA